MQPAANPSVTGPVVDVCVCTFQRPSLRATLESLAGQIGAPPFRVIVADNDDAPSAEAEARRAAQELGIEILYTHAPARNIAIARNACLDAAAAPLIAFIDDDELASPGWLAALLRGLEERGSGVVFGPVRAAYAHDAPAWAVRGDFHSVGPVFRAGGAIETGYAGNVLIRRSAIGAARFDLSFGGGGEDTMFFARLHGSGVALGYSAEAIVHEPAPKVRTTMQWLLRRSFRSGQTHARMLQARGRAPWAIAAPALAKAAYCGGAALLTAWSPVWVRANLIRGALHCGAVACALSHPGDARRDRVAQQ